ncbi:hypothetical protein HD599_003458 [Conyzicola lurida]|uniref:Capsular polysaccharide biosynthesis protein n=1 Tax=Conyzicola lurida TaxID=1172621 RepID=A0A841AU78_9MICO|nr:hypothetical protein [Conyzicola lurida]MBB5845135.1 hypothetical protein [Conyzicola lurida]
MLASNLLSASLRRWYVIVVGVLLTAGATYLVYDASEPTYEISGTAVLLPGSSTVPDGGNGFLYLGGLNPALEVLMRSVNSDATSSEILGDDPGVTGYTVERDSDASGPILLVTATSDTQSGARSILRAVLDTLPVRLAALQNDVAVPDAARMSVLDLAVDEKPTALTNDRTRGVLGVAAGGLVATFLLTALVDGLVLSIARRRRQRRERLAAAPAPEDEPDDTGEATADVASARPRKKRPAGASAHVST